MLARNTTLLPKIAKKTLPWERMLSDLFDHLKTNSFGLWDTNHWDVVFGKLDGAHQRLSDEYHLGDIRLRLERPSPRCRLPYKMGLCPR